MEDKTNNENLDLLFTGSIEPVETEPSEQFWRKASGEILKRENSGYKQKVFAWRSAALLFASMVVILSAYTFYIHTEINTIEQKIAIIEKKQISNTVQADNKFSNETNNAPGISINNQQTISNTLQNGNNSTLAINNSSSTPISNSGNGAFINRTKNIHSSANNVIQGSISNQEIVSKNLFSPVGSLPDKIFTDTVTQTLVNESSSNFSGVVKDTFAKRKIDSSDGATDTSLKPNVVSNQAKAPKSKDVKPITDRLYISVFFAPKVEDDYLSGNDVSSNTTSKEVKTREVDQFSYNTGLRLGYDLSSHWSVFTGFYYHASSFSVKPVLVAAQQEEDGQVGYSVTTSSGVVNFTNADYQPRVGDTVKASINSSRNYISIPFQLRYDFTTTKRLGFYLTAGFALNFAYNNATDVHWENTLFQEGDIVIRDVPDIDNVQYTYMLAGGLKYLVTRRFSLFIEPGFQSSFAAINKNAPIKAYPLFFGLSAGLTYHF